MVPPPESEPYLPQLELDVKALVTAELSGMAWEDIHALIVELQWGAANAISQQGVQERRKGNYDIMDLEGVHGEWGEELLPAHYQGTHWRSFDAGNGTAEVVRLSPLKFQHLYENQWKVEAAIALFEANHNRTPGDALVPVRQPARADE